LGGADTFSSVACIKQVYICKDLTVPRGFAEYAADGFATGGHQTFWYVGNGEGVSDAVFFVDLVKMSDIEKVRLTSPDN
jgi:hypothetical protein